MSRNDKVFNIPNLLCFYRIAIIPVIVVLFFYDNALTAWTNTLLFFLAGLSDFFDGRIARATGQTTVLGKFLDASTDKMLVGVMLMLLVAFDRVEGVWIIPAIIIYLREILIAGVREFMGIYNVVVPISQMGKWKLTLQMLAIGFLTAGPYGDMLIPYAHQIGLALFVAAAIITVVSGWSYVVAAWKTIRKLDAEKAL
jgi:cardiolipin synthase